ncbi:MAG: anthranilate phosphoribosyltransferase [Alphaproteobacteria bacterium]|nr:anthranilate phosphoribosyltransferase [Alphaproteobacteria bacterium]
MDIPSLLNTLEAGENLSEADMSDLMTRMMEGTLETRQTADILRALALKGETVEELTGAARVLRSHVIPIRAPYDSVDCCGTGGDKKGSLNISTAVAIVAASCGVPVAKHGNRASSSKSGAADVLEAIGVNLDIPFIALEEALEDFNFCFLMAPAHHTAMKHVAAARKMLGSRTIFNLLGPLANPAGTRLQLLGVFDRKWIKPMAETLKHLGSKRAWVVHGSDGMDEITLAGPTYCALLNDEGHIEERTLHPDDFGLPPYNDPEALAGGDAQFNAMALRALLQGKEGAYRDTVLANTAAVLVIHNSVRDLKTGVIRAAEAIDSGDAQALLRDYIAFTRSIDDAV